jgi:hypothetical protein
MVARRWLEKVCPQALACFMPRGVSLRTIFYHSQYARSSLGRLVKQVMVKRPVVADLPWLERGASFHPAQIAFCMLHQCSEVFWNRDRSLTKLSVDSPCLIKLIVIMIVSED